MAEKTARLKAGASPDPFIDPDGYRKAVANAEQSHLRQLEEERSGKR